MLDPRSLTDDRERIEESCRRRGVTVDVEAVAERYRQVAALRTQLGELNRRRNEHQKAGKRKLEPAEREAHVSAGRALKEEVAVIESSLAGAEADLQADLGEIPNLVHPDVPAGGEDQSRELRRVGEPTRFTFEPLDHVELGRRLALLDFEAGTRVAAPKFYYLKNEAVLLDLALQRMALDMVRGEGFELLATPDLAKPEIVDGIGFNPRGPETQIYSIANADLCLIGTAEITLGGLFADTVLEESALPLQLAGVSHCFRTEAGSHGRESKGLYRVHQFTKVEMFAITTPETSDAMHERLLALEERFFSALEIPYRVLDIAAGDLGAPAYRKFDLEAWMPGRGEGGSYGEITSTSNCTDYQARRLGVRFRREGGKRTEYTHMLNGTAVAIARALVALLENHQQVDGTVRIPKALQSYTGFDRLGG